MTPYSAPGILTSHGITFTSDSNRTIRAVSAYFEIKEEQLLSMKTRRNPIRRARQITAYLLRQKIWSLKQIGDLFGQDHTTIIHSCKTVQNMIDTEPDFAEAMNKIKESIYH